jgi:hypothetical protein
MCGASITWEDLIRAITAQDRLNLNMANHETNANLFLLERAYQGWRSGVRLELLSLLHRYHVFESTDPRDKIFAVTALSKKRISKSIALRADYKLGTSALYRRVAFKLLQPPSGLNMLSFPRRWDSYNPHGLPSWVPDWSWSRRCPCLGLSNYADINDLGFAASRASKSEYQLDQTLTALGLSGFMSTESRR